MLPLSQVGDFVLHGGGDLLQPIAKLHLLGGGVLLQRCDDLRKDALETLEESFLHTARVQRDDWNRTSRRYLVVIFVDVLVQLV